MPYKRIIPCLDVKNGRVVKGVNFVDFRDAGDPVEFAKYYSDSGADEIALLDITATVEGRRTIVDVVERAVKVIDVPLAIGGGIRSEGDCEHIFAAGAAKASINSAAVRDPSLVERAAKTFGSGRIIVAVDVKRDADGVYRVVINGGNTVTELEAVDWCRRVASLGAGEILLTSMDADGTKAGYDIPITRAVVDAVGVPVIMSGGCGKLEDFYTGFTEGGGDAALAASLFHFRELTIPQVKEYLRSRGIEVRL